MPRNSNLNAAAKAKKDEFYTQLADIEKELRHYRQHFQGKTVFCNCDDPFESNFFKYFVLNFNRLGLKEVIATCYTGSPIANRQLSLYDVPGASRTARNGGKPYVARVSIVRDATGDGGIDMDDIAELFKIGENSLKELEGDGDFRSQESINLLKQSDCIVTNPPFSLFREYIAQLFQYKKKFIIIGNINAVSYKEFFPLLMNDKVWIGPSIHSGDRKFNVPDDYPLNAAGCGVDENGKKFIRVKGVRWFTNLDIKQRHEEMILTKKYSSKDYPKFNNYKAINIDMTANIPKDYSEVMGVPITFLDKYNPDQFEILSANDYRKSDKVPIKKHGLIKDKDGSITVNGMTRITYPRILIRNRHPEVANAN